MLGGTLFFIVIGDGDGARMPARQRFAGQAIVISL
jgi:hypothetical protein